MAGQTEDVPYIVSDFATPDKEEQTDEDQPNKSVLQDVIKYLDEQIKTQNSLDLIVPEGEQIMSTQQQVVVRKEIVKVIRDVRSTINSKIKELR